MKGETFRNNAACLFDAIFVGCDDLAIGREEVVRRLEADTKKIPALYYLLAAVFWLFGLTTLFKYRKTFGSLNVSIRAEYLNSLLESKWFLIRTNANLICLPFKLYYTGSPEVHHALSIPYEKEKITPEPEARWMKQIFTPDCLEGNEEIEADVVVVGTGAGGAVVAKELAEKGFAVAIIEAGDFYRRETFNGNPKNMMPKLYLAAGLTASIGNAFIPVPLGKAVGGSTLINSGTCYRTPEDILETWVRMGLTDFSADKMEPYFNKVEKEIHVETAEAKYIGPIGDIIKSGCDKLGYHCGPLSRNSIDCDGQGVCTQACSKDAKQSTNISYIPKALNSCAQLFTGFEARAIICEGERVTGIRAYAKNGRKLTVRARATILSCGSLATPNLIRKNKLVRGNKWIGSNLSYHPAGYVAGVFPGIDMKNPFTIPQGYMIDEFEKSGIMLEGATAPFVFLASMMPGVGREYMNLVKSYENLAVFGFMIKDTSTGFVRPGYKDLPFIFYNLNRPDRDNLLRAMNILCDVFAASGAERLILPTFNAPVVEKSDFKKIRDRHFAARDMLLSAYHPLGTARIGLTRDDSATDCNHQRHEVPGLFVVDGSSVPTSLGVNPQITIMAFATRAADRISKILN